MAAASGDEIAELMGERADETVIDRIVATGASLDEVNEALEDLDYEMRFGEPRESSSPRVEEVRHILEELPHVEDMLPVTANDDEDDEGLTVIGPEELGREPY